MDSYKRVIKSRKLRLWILKILFFIPNKMMLKIQYRFKFKRKLNLKDPQRYSEKIQLYKLKYRNPILREISNKSGVSNYVKHKGLEHLLIKNYGVYNRFKEIDFTKLPQKFVVKSNNGGGGNQVFLVENKDTYDFDKLKKIIKQWPRKTSSRDAGREWGYGNIKTKIVIQEMLPRDNDGDIPDYKFFCFNGKPSYFYVIKHRKFNSNIKGDMIIYDAECNVTPYVRKEFKRCSGNNELPNNIDEMLRYAEILSKDFPHARVDLYNIEGKIYFGEITFYNASGYALYEPDRFDYILGEQFTI